MIDTILGFAGVTALVVLGVYIFLSRRKIRRYENTIHKCEKNLDAAMKFIDGQVGTTIQFMQATKKVLEKHKIDDRELFDEIQNIK